MGWSVYNILASSIANALYLRKQTSGIGKLARWSLTPVDLGSEGCVDAVPVPGRRLLDFGHGHFAEFGVCCTTCSTCFGGTCLLYSFTASSYNETPIFSISPTRCVRESLSQLRAVVPPLEKGNLLPQATHALTVFRNPGFMTSV